MLSDPERLTLRGRNQAFRQEATPRAQWPGARSGSGIFSGWVGVGGHPFAGARRGEGSMEGITALSTARKRCWLCASSGSLLSRYGDILW